MLLFPPGRQKRQLSDFDQLFEALNLAHDVGLEAHLLGPNDVPGCV